MSRSGGVLCRVFRIAVLAVCMPVGMQAAQNLPPRGTSGTISDATRTPGERRASAALERARHSKSSALDMEALLRRMPKGGDLHMHLSGAIYAETFLRDAATDHLCIDRVALRFVKPGQGNAACPADTVPASTPFTDQDLYDQLVDSFSMRAFVPREGVSGHDQFFATFARFGGLDANHTGEWLDEVASRAAAQNEQYLEIMITPTFGDLAPVWTRLGWPAAPAAGPSDPRGDTTGTSAAELQALRQQLLSSGLRDEALKDEQELADSLAQRSQMEHCGQPAAAPACSVTIRFLYQILRANPPQQVFAQTLLGFEVANEDEDVVGINFVQPEDAYLAMSEYSRQMHMLDFLHGAYPKVHITLHAGELAPGLVPPTGLRFHIREAVDIGHAERIGHGVDIMHEDDPQGLLRELADRHIAVEINLTSNDVILGVLPPHHPLPDYLAAHVPVALSTDDEGVSRIDLTHEYLRASVEYGLGYVDLKDIARASIEYSFLPGESLWAREDDYRAMKPSCAAQKPGQALPSADCMALLKSSEKAAQQWELEKRFVAFEASIP